LEVNKNEDHDVGQKLDTKSDVKNSDQKHSFRVYEELGLEFYDGKSRKVLSRRTYRVGFGGQTMRKFQVLNCYSRCNSTT
jgi:hypothetical protein